MRSEIRHKRANIVIPVIPMTEVPKLGKFIEMGTRIEFTRGCGEKGESLLHGYRVCVWDDEKILELDSGDSCTTW